MYNLNNRICRRTWCRPTCKSTPRTWGRLQIQHRFRCTTREPRHSRLVCIQTSSCSGAVRLHPAHSTRAVNYNSLLLRRYCMSGRCQILYWHSEICDILKLSPKWLIIHFNLLKRQIHPNNVFRALYIFHRKPTVSSLQTTTG